MSILIYPGPASATLAGAIATHLGVRLGRCDAQRFPDGELHVQLQESARGQDVYLVQSTSPPVETHLLELLLLADAARRAGVAHVTAVVPYFGYARQDLRANGREAVGARLIADLLPVSGIERLVAVDLHSASLEGFFGIPLEHLSAVPRLVEAVQSQVPDDAVIVAPDLGAAKLADRYAKALDRPVAIVHKTRLSARTSRCGASAGTCGTVCP
jgi:ribose-phosphate pyrophosphokinase